MEGYPENRGQPVDGEMEIARAEEEDRKERRSEGLYFMGVLQGLLLGIGGNLVVAYFMEVLRSIVSVEWWLVTNLIGSLDPLLLKKNGGRMNKKNIFFLHTTMLKTP